MAAWLMKADCLDSFSFELLLLMVQKSCDHQLRLVGNLSHHLQGFYTIPSGDPPVSFKILYESQVRKLAGFLTPSSSDVWDSVTYRIVVVHPWKMNGWNLQINHP